MRRRVRDLYRSGKSRCVVSTTALALGVNLPATHVVVRDTTFIGFNKKLSISELLQMMGRAGRSNIPGKGYVILKENDTWKPDELQSGLLEEVLPELTSSFSLNSSYTCTRSDQKDTQEKTVRTASLIASYLSRSKDGATLENINYFFNNSLGGNELTGVIGSAKNWLVSPQRVLAYEDEEGLIKLTALGKRSILSTLPLEVSAGVGQLIRDVLQVDPKDKLLSSWGMIDHLIVLYLTQTDLKNYRRFSKKLVAQVDSWMERNPDELSILYREWIRGEKGKSKALEVFGSLGIFPPEKGGSKSEWARKKAFQATFNSIVLLERSKGHSIESLERSWGVKNFGGVEERSRDSVLWLLSGLEKILDLPSFYYHLVEICGSDQERIKRVKSSLKKLSAQTFDLQEQIKYCSALGPMLRSIRRSAKLGYGPKIGIGTIRKLEDQGIISFQQLASLEVEDLKALGVRKNFAIQIKNYIRRSLQ